MLIFLVTIAKIYPTSRMRMPKMKESESPYLYHASHSCKRAPPSSDPRGIFRRVIAIRQSVVVVQSQQFIGRLKSQRRSGRPTQISRLKSTTL